MSGIDLTIQGDLLKMLNGYVDKVEDDLEKAVASTALAVQGSAVRRIQRGPASGRIYQKYNPRRTHQASAPGEAPASDTGRLAGSIQANQTPARFPTWRVGTNVPYGRHLEFGTTRILERPWLRPSVEEHRAAFQAKIKKALKRIGR